MTRIRILPRCAAGENIFISSEGFLLPCCYAHILLRRTMAAPEGEREPDLWFHRHRDAFDLRKRPMAAILEDPLWQELKAMWAEDRAPGICYRYCGVPADSQGTDPHEVRRQDRELLELRDARPPAASSCGGGRR